MSAFATETRARPVVGQNIVVGSKRRYPTKLLERPPHKQAPATWHLDHAALESEGPLSREHLEMFYRDGFLLLPDFFGQAALDAVRNDVEQMIDDLAVRLHDAGKIRSCYSELDWTSRLVRMREDFPDAPLVLIKGGVLPAAMKPMFADKRILDIAAQLGVGPDIALNPAWNLRAKMRSHEETTVPWHQDNSYWEPRIWDERVLTVWVALVDAVPENGCMQFTRGGHLSGKTATHTVGSTTSTWYTELSAETVAKELYGKESLDASDIVTIPAKAGSLLIFPGTTPHRSINSSSDAIRWSCDFRLHPAHSRRPGKTPLDWFYGLKDALVLRGADGKEEPEWDLWANVDRTVAQNIAAKGVVAANEAEEKFDAVVVGPWMDLWDIEEDARENPTNPGKPRPNRHVGSYLSSPEETRNIQEKYLNNGNW